MVTSSPPGLMSANGQSLPLFTQGKIRSLYACPDQCLLIVTSDKISAFDHTFDRSIPGKGEWLSRISRYWFERSADVVVNHLLDQQDVRLKQLLSPKDYRRLGSRSMVVRRSRPLPIEAIVRQYLEGSAWQEYQMSQTVGGQACPAGLKRYDRLPSAVFTPSTKAALGKRDQPLTEAEAIELIGADHFNLVRDKSLALFQFARELAEQKGLILCDTKFEFGFTDDGELMLIDEILTPDSSRYWLVEDHLKGQVKPMDKQCLRDWLMAQGFSGQPPAPDLTDEVVDRLAGRYRQLLDRLLG